MMRSGGVYGVLVEVFGPVWHGVVANPSEGRV